MTTLKKVSLDLKGNTPSMKLSLEASMVPEAENRFHYRATHRTTSVSVYIIGKKPFDYLASVSTAMRLTLSDSEKRPGSSGSRRCKLMTERQQTRITLSDIISASPSQPCSHFPFFFCSGGIVACYTSPPRCSVYQPRRCRLPRGAQCCPGCVSFLHPETVCQRISRLKH